MYGLNFVRVIYNTRCIRLNPGINPCVITQVSDCGVHFKHKQNSTVSGHYYYFTFRSGLGVHNEFSRGKN